MGVPSKTFEDVPGQGEVRLDSHRKGLRPSGQSVRHLNPQHRETCVLSRDQPTFSTCPVEDCSTPDLPTFVVPKMSLVCPKRPFGGTRTERVTGATVPSRHGEEVGLRTRVPRSQVVTQRRRARAHGRHGPKSSRREGGPAHTGATVPSGHGEEAGPRTRTQTPVIRG